MDSIGSTGRWIEDGRAKVRDGELVLAGGGKQEVKERMGLNWVCVVSWNEDSDNNKGENSKGTSSMKNGIYPSRKDLDMYFMDSSFSSSSSNNDDFDETEGDIDDRDANVEDGEYEKSQEPLYPGLYRALNQRE
jgi:hypothetical protein